MLSESDLALRRTGVGASEAWKPALGERLHELWLEKVRPDLVVRVPNVAMMRGVALEPLVADLYAERYGVTLVGDGGGTQRHPERPRVLATLDRLVALERGDGSGTYDRIVEIKVPTVRGLTEIVDGRVVDVWGPDGSELYPLRYRIQVLVQMAVTGIHRADLVMLHPIDDAIRVYPVTWDAEAAEMIMERIERFWETYVATQTPPPPDGSRGADDFLSRRWASHTSDLREPNPEPIYLFPTGSENVLQIDGDEALAHEIRVIRSRMAELESRERLLVQAAKERTADASGVKGCWTWKAPRSGPVAWKQIATELGATPELISKHTGAPSRVFRLTGERDQ